MTADAQPFGTYALSPARRWMKAFAGQKPATYGLGRLRYSIFRRVVHWGRGNKPIDLEIFEGVRARLHIWDNTTDRLVYRAAEYWDLSEREALTSLLQKHQSSAPFVFVDIGANSGFYSLWVIAQARRLGRNVRVLSIEPDAINRARLLFNCKATDAAGSMTVEELAVSDTSATGAILPNADDRGSNKLAAATAATDRSQLVQTELLARILAKHGIMNIDALKIDIEGGEIRALAPLLTKEPRDIWPRFVIAEAHAEQRTELISLFKDCGYIVSSEGKLNCMFELPEEAAEAQKDG